MTKNRWGGRRRSENQISIQKQKGKNMQQYLNLLRDILDNGKGKSDPQKVGNISSFVTTSRYKLKDGFPLITTRSLKNSWKAIVGELLWFLSGSTRIKDLH